MIQPTALNFFIVLFMLLIAGFMIRSLAARNSDNAFGQALSYIY